MCGLGVKNGEVSLVLVSEAALCWNEPDVVLIISGTKAFPDIVYGRIRCVSIF